MKKKLIIIIIFILAIVVMYPKLYDSAGGITGKAYSNDKMCLGYSYTKETKNCNDCLTPRYCIGIPISNSNKTETEQGNSIAIKNTAGATYYTYTNTAGQYSLQLPDGWGVNDTDWSGKPISIFIATPYQAKKISDEYMRKIVEDESSVVPVISVVTNKPKDEATLLKNYSILYKSNQIFNPVSPSPFVKEIRKGDITEGCKGTFYSIRSNKRMYVVQICYTGDSATTEYINAIASSLKEF